jgi:beta-glucosidase-like glycosyl hydrolase
VVEANAEELQEIDLAPYRQLGNQARSVMIGHSVYPSLEERDLPATLSRRISTGLLREVVGFEGVSFSDDMEMHAVSDLGPFEEIGERALSAGSDVVFFCSQVERLPAIAEHLDRKQEQDQAFAARFDQACNRAEQFREHCQTLRTECSDTGRSFDDIRDSFREFCEEFDRVCQSEEGERRAAPRTPGTGRTGREEWT